MANSEFLKNLKNAVDNGEFNSDAAKRINDIDNLADEKKVNNTTNILQDKIMNRVEESGVKTINENDITPLNSEYEEKMNEIKKQDIANKQLATLISIEDMVNASIDDMFSYIDNLEKTFNEEMNSSNPIYNDLLTKINEIKLKFNINN